MFAREVSLFTGHASDGDGALPFQKTDYRRHRVLWWNRKAHMYMVWHQVSFDDLALFLFGQGVENWPQLKTRLAKDGLASSFGHEYKTNTTWYLQSHFEWDRL